MQWVENPPEAPFKYRGNLISQGLIPRRLRRAVIPAKAGIQKFKLDAGSGPA